MSMHIMYGDRVIARIKNPKLLLVNVITTWTVLFLHACGLLPKWWYTLMINLGGGALW